MQEKEQKISPIKQRILQFVDTLGISKREFYTKINVSRGTLESKSGITEDILTKFLAIYPNISPIWLLNGSGEMFLYNEKVKENYTKIEAKVSNKSSQIKQRLLNYINKSEISKKEFCLKTNFDCDFFDSNIELSEFEIIQIATTFDELDLEWLLLGKGYMIKQVVIVDTQEYKCKIQELIATIRDKDKIIKLQEKLLISQNSEQKMQNAG